MASDEEDVDGDEDDKRLVEEDDVEAGWLAVEVVFDIAL